MKCHFCDNDSSSGWIFKTEHWCAICEMTGGGKIYLSNNAVCEMTDGRIYLCNNHRHSTLNFDLRHSTYGSVYDLCPNCYQWRIEAAAKVIIVRSAHISGHKLIKNLGFIETKHRHRDMDSSKWEICYNAHLREANGIVNLSFIPHRE